MNGNSVNDSNFVPQDFHRDNSYSPISDAGDENFNPHKTALD